MITGVNDVKKSFITPQILLDKIKVINTHIELKTYITKKTS
jgi:hypothetical protein